MQALSKEDIEIMKHLWALMLHNGRPTDPNATWSYYGGHFSDQWNLSYDKTVAVKKALIDDVKSIGVNFSECDVPEYTCYSEFVDTFSPSADVHVWAGYIALNDGSRRYVTARDIDLRPLVNQLNTNDGNSNLVEQYFG